jgi:membrane protease YdiL (CAAX protease family)
MNRKKELREFIAFLGFFYILPIFLLYRGYLPFYSFRIILFVVGIILIAYSIDKKIPKEKLGFRKDNLLLSLAYSGIISAVGLVILALLWGNGIISTNIPEISIWSYAFYVLISVPLQEFIFRSLMFYELDLFLPGNKLFAIVVSAIVYASAHLMFRDLRVFGVTLLIGLIWGWLYAKLPNFWGVAISHMILGAAAVAIGIV